MSILVNLRRFFMPVGLMAAGTFFAALVTEIALRVREFYQITNQEQLYLFRANPNGTGSYRLRPNLHERLKIGDTSIEIRTNSHGMPWREIPVEKSDGRNRIAFVGDSFTFGSWAVSNEASFVGRVDHHLANHDQPVEILNFGTGGYGFDDMELLIREEVVRFAPDVIVLCSFNGNDFRDTFLGPEKYDVTNGTARYHRDTFRNVPAEHHPAEDLTLPVRAETKQKFWTKGSAIKRLFSSYMAVRPPPTASFEDEAFTAKQLFTEYTFWSQVPLPPVGQLAKDISLATINRIHRHASSHGIQLMIVAIPFREQVYSREISAPGYDIRLPQQYLRDFARTQQIPYYDLLPALRVHVRATQQDPYLWGDIHFSNSGHSLVGQFIADWLVRELPGGLEYGSPDLTNSGPGIKTQGVP